MNNANEEEFKKSLNDILNSKEFEFDEANWQGAKKLIDEAKQKRRFALYFLLPLLLFIPLSFYLLFFNVKPEPKTTSERPLVETTKTNVGELKTESEDVIKNKFPVNKNKPSQKKNFTLPSASKTLVPENKVKLLKPESALKPSDVVAQSPVSPVNPKSDAPAVEKQKAEPVTVNGIAKENSNPVKAEDKLLTNKLTEAAGITSAKEVVSEQLEVPDETKKEESSTPSLTPNSLVVETTDPASNNNLNLPTSLPGSVKENELANRPESQVEEKSTPESSVISAISPTSEPLQVNPLSDSLSLSQNQLKPDTATSTALPSKDPCAVRDKVFVEVGMNYTFGWTYNGAREAAGINPVLGIIYSNKINQKITASAGLRYTTLSRLQLSSKTSKITTYKLGEESDVTVITPQKVYYISVPLQLAYRLNCNNQIGIGYNLDVMVNTNSSVETYHKGISKESNHRSTKSLGYQEGFKPFSSRVSLLYRRRIYKEFWLSAEATLGLTDLKDNTFFKQQVFERNTGIGLSLMYNILKH